MVRDTATGLVLSTGALEWTTLRGVKDRLEVTGSGVLDLSPDSETPGAVDTSARIKTELKGRIGGGPVVACVSSDQVLMRVIGLPKVDDEEIAGIVDLKAEELSPFPVETMVVSHEVLKRDEEGCLVLIAAVKKDIVEPLGQVLQPAGLQPGRIDISILGEWRLLRDAGRVESKGRQVVLLLRNAAPEMIVVRDGQPIALRSIGDTAGLSEDELAKELAREVTYTLMSVEMEFGSGPCTIALWGRGTGSLDRLADGVGQQCACGITVCSLDDLPPLSEGLARRGMGAEAGSYVDLVPEAWKAERKAGAFKRRVLMAGAAVMGVWALFVGGLMGGLSYEGARLTGLKAEEERWRAPALAVRDMRRRIFVIERYMDTTHSAIECLRDISLIQPDGLDLMSFTYSKGESVKLLGEAADRALILAFKDDLDRSKLFTSVRLGSQALIERKNRWSFDLELTLPGGSE